MATVSNLQILINKAKSIVGQGNYTYSNDILYGTCGGVSILPNPVCTNTVELDKFASAMLMIGRAYSASPQRSANANEETKANGTADFFNDVAEIIVKDSDYEKLYNDLNGLSDKNYLYNRSNTDFDLLKESLGCVLLFNEILKNAISQAVCHNSSADVKNNISFCSKFLHFVLPKVFFIKDSISLEGGKKYIQVKKGELSVFGTAVDNTGEYASHILRTYEVGCILTNARISPTAQVKSCISFTNGNPVCSMPRLVDSVLMQ